MKFRTLNKLWADLFGYFWLPCPSCGEMFGGHEWKTISEFSSINGKGICPDCTETLERSCSSYKHQARW